MIDLNKIPDNERRELIRIYVAYKEATRMYRSFSSSHEAYAIIMEEIEEWWHFVKNHDKEWGGIENQKNEIQSVGAMVLRFLIEM